jgi:hypothetical protein
MQLQIMLLESDSGSPELGSEDELFDKRVFAFSDIEFVLKFA